MTLDIATYTVPVTSDEHWIKLDGIKMEFISLTLSENVTYSVVLVPTDTASITT